MSEYTMSTKIKTIPFYGMSLRNVQMDLVAGEGEEVLQTDDSILIPIRFTLFFAYIIILSDTHLEAVLEPLLSMVSIFSLAVHSFDMCWQEYLEGLHLF